MGPRLHGVGGCLLVDSVLGSTARFDNGLTCLGWSWIVAFCIAEISRTLCCNENARRPCDKSDIVNQKRLDGAWREALGTLADCAASKRVADSLGNPV